MDPVENYNNCCLSPTDTENCMVGQLPGGKIPDNVADTACRNIFVRYCRSSDNITSDKCRTFISKMNKNMPPLPDMDAPIEAFCAMHREEKDDHFKDCACVNVANTCAGQKVIKFKNGNPACYFDDCKMAAADSTIFLTSSLYGPECKSVDCSIGPINIQMGKGNTVDFKNMINQKCGNANDRQPGDPPWTGTGSSGGGTQYTPHTGNSCTADKLSNGSSTVKKDGAAKACQSLCDARNDCLAFQVQCKPGEDSCACDLFSGDGYDMPMPPECYGADAQAWKSQTITVGAESVNKFDHNCKGKNLVNTNMWSCYDHRDPPPASGDAPAPAP